MMNKHLILLSLSNLMYDMSTRGFIRVAQNINNILYNLLQDFEEDEEEEKQENDDLSAIINTVGLRGDTKPEEPWGGVSVEPFFFDSGDLRY